MKTGTAVKVYSIMMGLLLLFALVMTGGNVKAADNEAMTIQIQPGDDADRARSAEKPGHSAPVSVPP